MAREWNNANDIRFACGLKRQPNFMACLYPRFAMPSSPHQQGCELPLCEKVFAAAGGANHPALAKTPGRPASGKLCHWASRHLAI